MDKSLFSDKFTTHLKQVLTKACDLSLQEKNSLNLEKQQTETQDVEISLNSLLQALKQEKGSIAYEILNKTKKEKHEKQALLENKKISASIVLSKRNILKLSAEVADIITKSIHLSQEHKHKYIGTEHLLKTLTESKNEQVLNWWKKENIDVLELEKNLRIVMESTSKFPDLTAVFSTPKTNKESKENEHKAALLYFGRELTDKNIQDKIDPLIGRVKEVERLIQILSRRNKNNPILLGEAGVGKTAIVEGLAKKISQGDVPPILANKKIYTVDLGSMVAGTVYRGEFEARFKNLIEAAEADGNAILFIDEIHTVIGAGSASGSLDAANMLKPALARGALSLIGATTVDEYKKHIETDSALERRFQVVMVDEPSQTETESVLAGIKANYEKFHNVIIKDEAIKSATYLSSRYITDKLQPDKSIDLIDEAAAKVKVARSQKSIWQKIRKIEQEITECDEQKNKAVKNEEYTLAMSLKSKKEKLNKDLEYLMEEAKKEEQNKHTIEKSHILEIISSITKIPLGELQAAEKEMFIDLENRLKEKITGQDDNLNQIADLIRRSRAQISDPEKPLASFIFLGPSGVGKTETAKQLAEILFQNKKSLIRIDMSEFNEGFAVSKLVGAPAGYVGYRDSNKFTDAVRRNPYSVILLDEIEKGHPDVFNILLQVLEDGILTDSTGRVINFKNTIIIMTSNIGIGEFNQAAAKIGFDHSSEKDKINFSAIRKSAMSKLKNNFRPEFINRIDKVLVFNPLQKTDIHKIVENQVKELESRLMDKKMKLSFTDKAKKMIIEKGYSPDYGARGVRRIFQESIETELAKFILKSDKAKNITIDANKQKFEFKDA